MPRRDGTGPRGMGPMTGRGMGCCAEFVASAAIAPGTGYGLGAGRGGGGRGWRNWYRASGLPGWARFGQFANPTYAPGPATSPVAEDQERGTLGNQIRALQDQLNTISNRLDQFTAKE